MKLLLFKILSRLNKAMLPTYWSRDLSELTRAQQLVIGYKIWVTYNYLDCIEHKKKGD